MGKSKLGLSRPRPIGFRTVYLQKTHFIIIYIYIRYIYMLYICYIYICYIYVIYIYVIYICYIYMLYIYIYMYVSNCIYRVIFKLLQSLFQPMNSQSHCSYYPNVIFSNPQFSCDNHMDCGIKSGSENLPVNGHKLK